MASINRKSILYVVQSVRRNARTPLLILCFVAVYGCEQSDNYVEPDPPPDPVVDVDDGPFPPEGDPSAFTGPEFGDLPDGMADANLGSFEGGETGTSIDTSKDNSIVEAAQRDDGTFNVPTNGPPSPLYSAQPFSQQMLRFEEFGPDGLDLARDAAPTDWVSLPAPVAAQYAPNGEDLESFLSQDIWPTPTEYANNLDSNPWQVQIESWLGRTLDNPPAEGRPPGQGWSHQRWEEFTPDERY